MLFRPLHETCRPFFELRSPIKLYFVAFLSLVSRWSAKLYSLTGLHWFNAAIGEMDSSPANPQIPQIPSTATACLQILAAQMAEDKAARRLVLSVVLALKEYGIVCAKYLTTWYAQRFGRQNADEEPNPRKLALKAVFDVAVEILSRDQLVAENMWFTPKVQQMLSLIGVMSQHRAGLVVFVKKRSSAYCLHRAASDFFPDLKAGSLVGFNALSKVRTYQ